MTLVNKYRKIRLRNERERIILKNFATKLGIATGVLLVGGSVVSPAGVPGVLQHGGVIQAEAASKTYVTKDRLNLRTGASTKQKVLLTIPKNKQVTVISTTGKWSKVKYGKKTGWVSTQYLKVVSPKVTNKTVVPTKKKGTAVKESVSVNQTKYVTTENLNMRTGSGTKYAVIKTIPKGETVLFIANGSSGWAKVSYSGKTGYVSMSYLELDKTSIKKTVYPISLADMAEKQYSLHAQTDKYLYAPAYVAKSLIKKSGTSGTVLEEANVRSERSSTSHIYGVLKANTKVSIIGESEKYYQVKYQAWRNARKSDILETLNPSAFSADSKEFYQFLDLSEPAGVTTSSMNKVLSSKGILANRGGAFIEASKTHHVNEVYLASHAMLETGNGTSQLSNGVLVKEVDGKKVEPKVVYNMFGIGAVDSAPLKGGSERAYQEGWFTPEKAIIGGAKFIGEKYVNNPEFKQNTLYKMRWNPEQPGKHQYATDIGWAVKQVPQIYNLYQLLDNYTLTFDVPVYSN